MKELGTIQYCGQASRVAIKELYIVDMRKRRK